MDEKEIRKINDKIVGVIAVNKTIIERLVNVEDWKDNIVTKFGENTLETKLTLQRIENKIDNQAVIEKTKKETKKEIKNEEDKKIRKAWERPGLIIGWIVAIGSILGLIFTLAGGTTP